MPGKHQWKIHVEIQHSSVQEQWGHPQDTCKAALVPCSAQHRHTALPPPALPALGAFRHYFHCGAQGCAWYTDVVSLRVFCPLCIWSSYRPARGDPPFPGAACEAVRHTSRFDGSLHPLDVFPGGFSSASLCSYAQTNGNSWHLETKRNPKQNGCPLWLLLLTTAALCCSITSVNAAFELCFGWCFLSMAFSSIPVCFEGCGVFHGLKGSFPFVLCCHHHPLPPLFALALQKLAHCRWSGQSLQATITPTQRSVPENRLEDISFTFCFLWVWCFSFI